MVSILRSSWYLCWQDTDVNYWCCLLYTSTVPLNMSCYDCCYSGYNTVGVNTYTVLTLVGFLKQWKWKILKNDMFVLNFASVGKIFTDTLKMLQEVMGKTVYELNSILWIVQSFCSRQNINQWRSQTWTTFHLNSDNIDTWKTAFHFPRDCWGSGCHVTNLNRKHAVHVCKIHGTFVDQWSERKPY